MFTAQVNKFSVEVNAMVWVAVAYGTRQDALSALRKVRGAVRVVNEAGDQVFFSIA